MRNYTGAMSAQTSPTTPVFPAIAFLGVGSMNGAILQGVLASGARVGGGTAADVRTTNHSSASSAALAERFADRITALAEEATPDANRRAAEGAGLIVLGVKPYGVGAVLDEIAEVVDEHAIVVSVAAGVTIASIAARLPASVAVLRAMPNTPAAVGAGVTGLAAAAGVSNEQRGVARALFETVGRVVELEESRIDALSAVSGSGPAYVYAYIEQFEQAAQQLGFSPEDARTLVEGTVIGAARLLESSQSTPEQLRIAVTSPGGTTAEALKVIAQGGQVANLHQALEAAVARAREMAAENG